MRAIDTGALAPPQTVQAGPEPMLQWIRIDALVVDDSYQRDLRKDGLRNVKRIADQFLWSRFSPVFVAPIEGGRFAVIDGQHRTHAAKLCGFEEVPCQVVQMSLEEQAASFAAINGLVTKVTGWQILRAAIVAGEPWALECAATCSDAGCTLMTRNASTDDKKPGEIYSLALIRGLVKDGHRKIVTATLKALRQSEFGDGYEAWGAEVLRPLLQATVERPWLAGVQGLSAFFDSFDIWAAIDQADDFVKRKRRQGYVGVSRYDMAAVEIGEGLDKMFPQRMALPAGAA